MSEHQLVPARAAAAPNPMQVPQSVEQIEMLAKIISRSDLAPKDYRGKPENTMVAIMMGQEIGVSPMQAVQGIAVINGRPSVWGDLLLALCRAHPLCDYVDESLEFDANGNVSAAICKASRNGNAQERRFSVEDAKRAGLWTKDGPWKQYPQRMLQMRARGFCLRDLFADALKGLASAEEQHDAAVVTVVSQPQPSAPAQQQITQERPQYPPDNFDRNLPRWRDAIASGSKTADDIIALAETKGALSEDQKAQIRSDLKVAA